MCPAADGPTQTILRPRLFHVCSAGLCSPQFQGPAILPHVSVIGDLTGASTTYVSEGERGPSVSPQCQSAVLSGGGGPSVGPSTSLSLSVCLSVAVSPDMLYERDGNRAVRRTRRAANLPGHLARLTLFKQVPRRLVSCLVKWLTF